MKIIYLHQYFKKPSENGGTRSFDLATSFIKMGISVEMVTTTSDNFGFGASRWRKEDVDGVLVHYLYLPYDNSFSFAKRGWIFLLFIWYSSRRLLKIDADLVLATSTPLTIGLPALFKKLVHRTPYIFEVRDVWPEAVVAIGAIKNSLVKRLLYYLEYLLYKHSRFIVPLSTDMQHSIYSRYPQFIGKADTVIENIAEIERFDGSYPKTNFLKNIIGWQPEASILYAGTFGKVNQIRYVIELAVRVLEIDESIVFLLLGTGAEKDKLIVEAKALGVLNRNLFFLEAVNKAELPKIYREVDMGSSFVAPIKELWANSANKFFDTLAAGKPVLINHYGWQAEKIMSANIGYVLPPDLGKANVEEFVSFIKDREVMDKCGRNSRKLAEDVYSLKISVEKYTRLFAKFNI